MDWKVATRVVAVLAFAVIVAACAIALRPDATEETPASTAQSQSEEPASSELLRCREIGAAALAANATKPADKSQPEVPGADKTASAAPPSQSQYNSPYGSSPYGSSAWGENTYGDVNARQYAGLGSIMVGLF